MAEFKVVRIRPLAWKISVLGKEGAEYLRRRLAEMSIETSDAWCESDLTEPAVYSFSATFTEETPLTSVELQAILERDDQVELAFDVP